MKSPLPTNITSGSSALSVTPRQYEIVSRSANFGKPCSDQLSPSSRLIQTPSGVEATSLRLLPVASASPWRSWLSILSPSGGNRVQVSPPSRLRNTPSISTPTKTVLGSLGSTRIFVTLGAPAKHSLAIGTASFSQLLPPSFDR